MMRTLAILVGVAAATPAHAEVRVGLMAGDVEIGGVTSGAIGPHAELGTTRGRWYLHGELAAMFVDEGDAPGAGAVQRLSAGARHEVWRRGEPVGGTLWAGIVVWVGAGVGVQRLAWDRGTEVRRGEISLEAAALYGFHGPLGVLGCEVGLAVTAARAPAPAMLPSCGEDCAREGARDLAMLFTLAIAFGR
jgi:hypothetical protein